MSESTAAPTSEELKHYNAVIVLADGAFFFGHGIGVEGQTVGELCFNTSITGYQEILTDPSYAGQVIVFTFPHIGNVGTNHEDIESVVPVAKGLVLRENITSPSNFRNEQALTDWLSVNDMTGICGVDTRALTRHIRLHGAQNATIAYVSSLEDVDIKELQALAADTPTLKGMELTKSVTCEKPHQWDEALWDIKSGYATQEGKKSYRIVALDYGVKRNILRSLAACDCELVVLPSTSSVDEIMKHQPDGVFLSNGPGDPEATAEYALPVIHELIEMGLPIFGICMGHQLLATALGAKTEKMFQGHRGANHPVQDQQTKKVDITSQNHGFTVSKEGLPDDIEVTHLSLFDQTVQGIASKSRPIFSVQCHPEASPGPQDIHYLFESFIQLVKEHQSKEQNVKEMKG